MRNTFVGKNIYQNGVLENMKTTTILKISYELSYKNEYTREVNIEQLDKESEESIYGVKLKGAFPVTINPIELSDGLTGQVTQLSVQLAFTDWEKL